ncbi:MAG: hypothetical protein LBQ15_11825 [Clostridium sp.]|jgi:hypothetical protein|nr:hypothetical protein [Clostridium sp.]
MHKLPKALFAITAAAALLCACADRAETDSGFLPDADGVIPEDSGPTQTVGSAEPADLAAQASRIALYQDCDDYRDAYAPWQLEAVQETDAIEGVMPPLRQNAEDSYGCLESYAAQLHAPLPAQTALDEIFLDAFHESRGDVLLLRHEMAVLLTLPSGGKSYSLVVTGGAEGRTGMYAVAWEKDGETIRILDYCGGEPPISPAAAPCAAEVAGRRVIFTLLQNHHFDGENPVPVSCGTFDVTLESGALLTQDVSGLACAMALLPEGAGYSSWTLTDTQGRAILRSQ